MRLSAEQGVDLIAQSIPAGPMGRVALLGGNLIAWAQGVDVGAWVSGASFVLLALVTVVVAAWEKLYQQRRVHRQNDLEDEIARRKALEALEKSSITHKVELVREQLIQVQGQLDEERGAMRARIEELMDVRLEEQKRHESEVRRLTAQVTALHESLDRMACRHGVRPPECSGEE